MAVFYITRSDLGPGRRDRLLSATFGRSTSEPRSLTIPVGIICAFNEWEKLQSYLVVSCGQSMERDGERGMLSR